jgi:hypothetical protein
MRLLGTYIRIKLSAFTIAGAVAAAMMPASNPLRVIVIFEQPFGRLVGY